MEERTKFHVGLDVHKDTISVAAAEPGRGAARLIGRVTHDVNKLLKVLARSSTACAVLRRSVSALSCSRSVSLNTSCVLSCSASKPRRVHTLHDGLRCNQSINL